MLYLNIQNDEIMTLAATKENNSKIKALKKVSETKWVGNTIHEDIEKCLTAMNLDSTNSGWYKPAGVRINGIKGVYMVNEDGSLFCEARVIKEDDSRYKIEYLTMSGCNEFESHYIKFLED